MELFLAGFLIGVLIRLSREKYSSNRSSSIKDINRIEPPPPRDPDVSCMICKSDNYDIKLFCKDDHALCKGCLIEWYFKLGNKELCLYCTKPIEWSKACLVS